MTNIFDPVILFFVLGVVGGLLKSDLKVPRSFYDTLSIYLLLAIGIKGGLELYHSQMSKLFIPALFTLILGVFITLLGYFLLRKIFQFDRPNAVALATHYGSVSAVTFAVVQSYLETLQIRFEEFMTVILVLLEVPAIVVGVTLAGIKTSDKDFSKTELIREVFLSKSILLLLGGLGIGAYIGLSESKSLDYFFLDLFKGFLSIFMLEMGLVASSKVAALKAVGFKIIIFGLLMPIISGFFGTLAGFWAGLSVGGTVILATLAASASYIAAPAAMRVAVPQANPTYYLTAALGITFPFNMIVGIPLYVKMVQTFFELF